jgi:hypothetical protein
MGLAAILLIISGALSSLPAQERNEAFIGTTDREKQLQHLYAVPQVIVDEVAKSQSNLVSRIFVFKVTKSDCCNPLSQGGNCFQCCDDPNHVVCTNSASVGFVLARTKEVSESEWTEAKRSEFKNVTEWSSIGSALERQLREVKAGSREANEFWGQLKDK